MRLEDYHKQWNGNTEDE